MCRALIAEERPDLIMLDWMLPGISGIEVCRLLRAAAGDARHSGHHAHGARRGVRARARPRDRRR